MTASLNCQSYDQTNLRNDINTFNKDTKAFIKKTATENVVDKMDGFCRIIDVTLIAGLHFIYYGLLKSKQESSGPISLLYPYNYVVPMTCIGVATAYLGRSIFNNVVKFKNHNADQIAATRFINDMNSYKNNELLPEDVKIVEQAINIAVMKQEICKRSKSAIWRQVGIEAMGCINFSATVYETFYEGFGYDYTSKATYAYFALNLSNSVLDHTKNNNARDAKHLRNITKVFKANLQAL